MTTYLVDTDVISETTKPLPREDVIAWLAEQPRIILSTVSIYELSRGIERVAAGRKRQFLEVWFSELLDGPIDPLPFDTEAAILAAQIESEARRKGRAIDTRDLFILASAKARGLHVATRNLAHFKNFGVRLYDPFSGREAY